MNRFGSAEHERKDLHPPSRNSISNTSTMGWGPLSSILSDAAVVLHSRVRSSYGLLGEAGNPRLANLRCGPPFSIFTQTDPFSPSI
jgi:hypothetical protein